MKPQRDQNDSASRTPVGLFAVLLLVLGEACASVPMATAQEDLRMKQNLRAPPGRSLIVLYRNEGFGSAVKMPVMLDGRVAGATAAHVYFVWEVLPGPHQLASLTENTARLSLRADPGWTYFVWQEVKMGTWQAGSALHLVDERAGRRAVAECKLAKSQIGPPPSSSPPVSVAP